VKNRKTNIKALLLNQKLISGIGNIYADEILFASGILPERTANTLTKEETRKVVKNSQLILKKAIQYRGTTFNNYVDAEGQKGNFESLLKIYGRVSKKCYKCRGTIKKKKVAGRGTHFCEKCQV
jgi:formamidopyrimidine-DNA glycosylase